MTGFSCLSLPKDQFGHSSLKKSLKAVRSLAFFFFSPPVFNPETEDVFLFPFLPLYSSLYRIKENFQTKDNLAQRHQCSQACTSWNTRALRSNMLSSGLVFHPERWDMRKNTNWWCCSKQHLSFSEVQHFQLPSIKLIHFVSLAPLCGIILNALENKTEGSAALCDWGIQCSKCSLLFSSKKPKPDH